MRKNTPKGPARVDINSLEYRKAELLKNQALKQAASAKNASKKTIRPTAPNKKLK